MVSSVEWRCLVCLQAKAMPEGQVTVLFDMTDTGLTNMVRVG